VSTRDLVWIRAPQQARSQATLARLLDATEVLLDEAPFDDLSVQDICKAAKSSVGAFYARFADKTALLHVLHERLCDEAKATAADALDVERWSGVPLRDLIGATVGFIVVEYHQRRGLRRELIRRNSIDVAFRARSMDVGAFTVARLAALLADRVDELRCGAPQAAAEMVNRLLFGTLDQHATFAEHGPAGVHLADDDLARELTRALLTYLTAEQPTGLPTAGG
jgi:AcrR family transcriptional regulator